MMNSNSNSVGLADLPFLASSRYKNVVSRANCPIELPSRFLCVSNGYEIFCVDLKERNHQSFTNLEDIPLIPRIGCIDLMKNGLPTSVGLFRLGSHIYTIGGQNFPVSKVEEPHEDVQQEKYLLSKGLFYLGPDLYRIDVNVKPPERAFLHRYLWLREPKRLGLYKSLCARCRLDASSCDIYVVSLAEGTLSLSQSESDIAPPAKPKIWPIVETINGQTHVIDTLPSPLVQWTERIPSHEILSCDNKSWLEISMNEDMGYIKSHLVVGRRIYAVADKRWAVYDSDTQCWNAPYESYDCEDPYSLSTVWGILTLGFGRCVQGVVYGDPNNPLYVLIAVVQDRRTDIYNLQAIAYLVTLEGLIVCWQLLSTFFQGPVKPDHIRGGTMIDVDEKGETLCSIISGHVDVYPCDECIFIHTFTAKGFSEAKSMVQRVWEKGEEAWPVEQDFVLVEFKDRCVYKSHDRGESNGLIGVRACFFP